MEERLISDKELLEFLGGVMKDCQIYGPVKEEDIVFFKRLNSIDEVFLEYKLTTKPVKEIFFPQVQCLFNYKLKKYEAEMNLQQSSIQKRVVFGLRPCDIRGLIALDKVFTQDPEDNLYLSLRNNTVVISLACTSYANTCFCSSVGGNPRGFEGSDIFFAKVDNDYTIRTNTTQGEELIKKYMANLGTTSFERLQPQFPSTPKMKIDISRLKTWLDINFTNSIWERVASSCIGCAICTYLCPTCHCFDITDEVIKEEGKRFLVWDSCSFSSFTKTQASQPRLYQFQRFRQRIMHKFKYYEERFGVVGCVGCGRCINFCPVNINIVEVLNELINAS